MIYDCCIIGGGPAGLSAALVLGRANRRVLVLDGNRPRNAVSKASHGYLTRDGIDPSEFRKMAQWEIAQYPSVAVRECEAETVMPSQAGFEIRCEQGTAWAARTLLFATGLKEELPAIEGLKGLYGSMLYSCPYCDGWEQRGKALVQISEGDNAYEFARLLYQWSRRFIVCTNGKANLTQDQTTALSRKGIQVVTTPIASVADGRGRGLMVRFADDTIYHCEAGFVTPTLRSRSSLAASLGCTLSATGGIQTDGLGRTGVPLVYASGDAADTAPSQLIIAAGSGSKAAISVNHDLCVLDF